VNDYDIIFVSGDPFESSLRNLEDKVEGWTMMIWPVIVGHSVSKLALIVGGPLRRINDPILFKVSLVQEFLHLKIFYNLTNKQLTLSIGFLYKDSIPSEGYDIAII
jgi:hypothetical protein